MNVMFYEQSGETLTRPFIAGNYYNPEDLLNEDLFITFFTGLDTVLFCLGVEDGMAKFVILTNEEFNPVAPAVIMYSETTSSNILKLRDNETAADYLYTEIEDLDTATHRDYNYLFFEEDDYVEVFDMDNTSIGTYQITAITATTITLSGYLSTSEGDIYVTYPETSSQTSKQQKHLHLSGGIL